MNVRNFFDKGTSYYKKDKEKRLAQMINFIFYFLLLIIIPIALTYNLYIKDYDEVVLIVIQVFVAFWILHLNHTGRSQKSLIYSSFFYLTVSLVVAFINEKQMGAPYAGLLISLGAVLYVQNKTIRGTIFVYGFLMFVVTNTYQLMTKSFDLVEHTISILFVILIFLVFRYVSNLQNNYENQLEEQNQIIQEQSEELLKIQEEQHQQELLIRKHDIEKVVANNAIQIKIKENLIQSLKSVSSEKNKGNTINSILLELRQQIDSQKKISLQQESIEEINSSFYERLYTHTPNISNTEKELCSYIKLGLSTKEIAILKNTSTNTINVAKTRLRNKLGLQKNSEISSFLRNL